MKRSLIGAWEDFVFVEMFPSEILKSSEILAGFPLWDSGFLEIYLSFLMPK